DLREDPGRPVLAGDGAVVAPDHAPVAEDADAHLARLLAVLDELVDDLPLALDLVGDRRPADADHGARVAHHHARAVVDHVIAVSEDRLHDPLRGAQVLLVHHAFTIPAPADVPSRDVTETREMPARAASAVPRRPRSGRACPPESLTSA